MFLSMPWWLTPTLITLFMVVAPLVWPMKPYDIYHPHAPRWVWAVSGLVGSNVAWIVAAILK
jgi:hypothetical protein